MKELLTVNVDKQCSECVYGFGSDLFPGEWLCTAKSETFILAPAVDEGTDNCPEFKPDD